jgi:transposase, IS5 family
VGHSNIDNIPNATNNAYFREMLRKAKVIDELFGKFGAYLHSQGPQSLGGQIVDATLIQVPWQRNTCEENAEIKVGR